jgi:hypothetical protein
MAIDRWDHFAGYGSTVENECLPRGRRVQSWHKHGLSPRFPLDCIFPGNANLLIGVLPPANQEIGVPVFAPEQFVPTVL